MLFQNSYPDKHTKFPTAGLLYLFCSYGLIYFWLTPRIWKNIQWLWFPAPPPRPAAMILQMLMLTLAAIVMLLGNYLFLTKATRTTFWKKQGLSRSSWIDIVVGITAAGLTFVLLLFLSEGFSNLFTYFQSTLKEEQLAIRLLKKSSANPVSLIASLTIICALAPFTEELLFRGWLQNYLCERCSPIASIILTATAFSMLHLSPEQGLTNWILFPSLWILAFVAGMLYRRMGSFYTPLALHISFNIFSVSNLFLSSNYGRF